MIIIFLSSLFDFFATRRHQNIEILCYDCWEKKKEIYKAYIIRKKDQHGFTTIERNIRVHKGGCSIPPWEIGAGGELGNCQVCKKWDDEYVGAKHGGHIDKSICSAECQRKFDKGEIPVDNNNNPNRERERERDENTTEIQQLRSEIQQLESISNRTATQEQELKTKKERLLALEQQSQKQTNNDDKGKKYLPYILGGVAVIVAAIGIAFLVNKNKKAHADN